ncbi:LysM domain-containing protein [Abeliophyllum distichum]|uniref:LysM domain-containing protein n=1 Tax=Abeliophyllum distichum TaxID=126358 RepID=A0ABD1PVS0_9LAMI
MSNTPRAADGSNGKDNNDEMENTVAKTAGFVVFSGIAMSILKALNPFNKNPDLKKETPKETLTESTRIRPPSELGRNPCCQSPELPPLQEPIFENPVTTSVEQNVVEPSHKTIQIVKGDTLWGLSREYGVSIEEIKEANGLSGDTIYAGKKLIIP